MQRGLSNHQLDTIAHAVQAVRSFCVRVDKIAASILYAIDELKQYRLQTCGAEFDYEKLCNYAETKNETLGSMLREYTLDSHKLDKKGRICVRLGYNTAQQHAAATLYRQQIERVIRSYTGRECIVRFRRSAKVVSN